MSTNILDVFDSHRGIIAFVGAGGKKSTIYRLAVAHNGKIAVTSTVHTPRFRQRLNAAEVVSEEPDLLARVAAAANSSQRVAYARPSVKPTRLGGVSPDVVWEIHEHVGFDVTFVKADGARLRMLKSPNHNLPVLPRGTTVMVSVVSVRAVGKPLSDQIAHYAEDVARCMGINVGNKITAIHLARLMSTNHVVLDNTGNVKLIPVINMIESKEELMLARLVAEQALEQSTAIERVVLTSMIKENPVLEVIGGDGALA